MKSELFRRMDVLKSLWEQLEEVVATLEIKDVSTPLSIERYGEKMRLLYEGRPVIDCKVHKRIEATEHLESFYVAFLARHNEAYRTAVYAQSTLTRWLTKFKEITEAKE